MERCSTPFQISVVALEISGNVQTVVSSTLGSCDYVLRRTHGYCGTEALTRTNASCVFAPKELIDFHPTANLSLSHRPLPQ